MGERQRVRGRAFGRHFVRGLGHSGACTKLVFAEYIDDRWKRCRPGKIEGDVNGRFRTEKSLHKVAIQLKVNA